MGIIRHAVLPASIVLVACTALLLWPAGPFPTHRKFDVVSINGRAIADHRPTFYLATERRAIKPWPVETWASGSSGCNLWSSRVLALWGSLLGSGYHTAMACSPGVMETEEDFDAALRGTVFWWRFGADVILVGRGGAMRLVRSRE